MLRLRPFAVALCATVLAAACAKKEAQTPAVDSASFAPPIPAPSVSAIELGRALGTNNTISVAASTFGTRDTIYVSVTAQNALPSSSLTAKWTFQTGQLVDSTTQALARTDARNTTTVTEFHITKKTPWPAGSYKVELWLDGVSVGSRDFQVK